MNSNTNNWFCFLSQNSFFKRFEAIGSGSLLSIFLTTLLFSKPGYCQPTVKIGKQVWLNQNLETTRFSDGDPILHAQSAEEWEKAFLNKQPAWCIYELDSTLIDSTKRSANPIAKIPLGKLYNIYAMQDKRNVCPSGFKVPNNEDWETLIAYLDSVRIFSENDRIIDQRLLKSTFGWQPIPHFIKPKDANGNNGTGFNAFPTGYRGPKGDFMFAGSNAVFWSKTRSPLKTNWCFNISDEMSYKWWINSTYTSIKSGLSIRCIQDNSTNLTSK